jgi:hypothetical protein
MSDEWADKWDRRRDGRMKAQRINGCEALAMKVVCCLLSLAGLLQVHNWYQRHSRFDSDVHVAAKSGRRSPV